MRGQIDAVDLVAMPFFLIGGIFGMDLVSLSLGGYSMAEPLWSFANGYVSISAGAILSALAFSAVVATNDWRASGWGFVNTVLVVLTYLLILGPGFIPIIELALDSMGVAIVALIIESLAYTAVSYAG